MYLTGNLSISTPGREAITVSGDDPETLVVRCAGTPALRQLFGLRHALPGRWGITRLVLLRHPLKQNIRLYVADRLIVEWPPQSRPRLRSWRFLPSLVRRSRNGK